MYLVPLVPLPLLHPHARRRLGLSVTALLFVFVAGCSSPESSSPTPDPLEEHLGAPIAIAKGKVHDPAVAIDPSSGRIYVVWSKEAGTNAVFQSYSGSPDLAYSDDGGKTFSTPVAVSADPDEIGYTRPLIRVTPKGTVLVLWERSVPDMNFTYGQERLRIARSTDGGKSFTVGELLSDPTPTLAILPALHVDTAGVASILWLDYRDRMDNPDAENIPVQVRATDSKDDGATWSKDVLVNSSSCTCCRVSATSREGDRGWPAFAGSSRDPTPDSTIRDTIVSRSTDGATWDQPNKVHDDAWRINGCPVVGPSLTYDPSGRLHAVWYTGAEKDPGVFYASSMDDGHTFTDPTVLMSMKPVSEHMHGGSGGTSANSGVPSGTDPSAAVGASGAAWIAWTDGGSPPHVHLARVDEHGKLALRDKLDTGSSPQLTAAAERVVMAWGEDGKDASTSNTIWYRSLTP